MRGREAGEQPGERALERVRVVDQRHVGGERPGSRPARRRRSPRSAIGRTASTARSGAAGRRARRACRARTARPAAGEDDRRRSPSRRSSVRRPAARGPGTWPSGVRRRIPRRSRSSRIAITYLRLVPVASRRAAGVSGARAASAECLGRRARDTSASRRRGRLEDHDPAGPLELADAVGRAAGGAGRLGQGGGAGTARAARGGPSPRRAPGRARAVAARSPGRRTSAPSRTRRPSRPRVVDAGRGGRCRARVPTERRRDGGAPRGRDGPRVRSGLRPPSTRRRRMAASTSRRHPAAIAGAGRRRRSSAPWRSRRAAAIAGADRRPRPRPRARADRARPSGGGARSRGAARRRARRRRRSLRAGRAAQDEPVARRDRDRAGEPERSRRPRRRAGRARPGRSGRRSPRPPRSRGGRAPATGRAWPCAGATRIRSLATTARVVRQDDARDAGRRASTPARLSAVRPGSARSTARRGPGSRGPGPSGRPARAGGWRRGPSRGRAASRSRRRRGP